MLEWLKKEQANGRTGIVRSSEGIAIARISRGKALVPQLDHCQFNPQPQARNTPSGLAEALRDLPGSRQPCSWVLAEDDYQLLLVEAPDVEASELRAAVRWKIRDLIDFHVDDAAIDVFDVPVDQPSARARMMYVVACRAPLIQGIVDALERADFTLEVIDIAELAQRNVAALLDEDVDGVALLHFERDYGLITITRQANLYLTRKLELGFAQLAEALAADDDEGGEAPGERLRPILEQIALEVQRSLDYFDSHLSGAPVKALYINPPAGVSGDIVGFLEQSLGVTTKALDLGQFLGGQQLDQELQSRCLLAVGAALRMETPTL